MKSLLLTLLLASSAAAQLPPAAQISSDLAGDFACGQARPALKHRGEIMRRVEKILTQQTRYLISTMHPWEQDPSALLLTGGGSNEHNIRPNSHTAFALAVLTQCAAD